MAGKNHHRLFEELGLLDQIKQPNPYETLGLDPSFVSELLKENQGKETLQLAAAALHRVLAKRYHPDVEVTGDEKRFREISEAHSQIAQASTAALARWSRREHGTNQTAVKKADNERQEIVRSFTELFQDGLELGHHPHHFSQLPWAQGLLLQRANQPYLLRESPGGGVQITRGLAGQELGFSSEAPDAFSISSFLLQYDSFGLEPGTNIVAYITSERASIVDDQLQFIMDITDPVANYRQKRTFETRPAYSGDFWARAEAPVLMTTTVPDSDPTSIRPPVHMMVFPEKHNSRQSSVWHLPMEVVGTLQNPDFFRRVRHGGSNGAPALTGGWQRRGNYFNMASMSIEKLIEKDSQYSPLLGSKGSLVLYDSANELPVATDIAVMGMIGSDSRAT